MFKVLTEPQTLVLGPGSYYFIHKQNFLKVEKTKQTKPYVNKKVKIRRGTYEYSVGLKAPFMPGLGFGAHTNGRMRYLMLSLSYHYYEAQLYSSPVTHTLCALTSLCIVSLDEMRQKSNYAKNFHF